MQRYIGTWHHDIESGRHVFELNQLDSQSPVTEVNHSSRPIRDLNWQCGWQLLAHPPARGMFSCELTRDLREQIFTGNWLDKIDRSMATGFFRGIRFVALIQQDASDGGQDRVDRNNELETRCIAKTLRRNEHFGRMVDDGIQAFSPTYDLRNVVAATANQIDQSGSTGPPHGDNHNPAHDTPRVFGEGTQE